MDDLISKQALKEDLLKRGFYPVIVKRALEDAPAVDAAEVKHGRWKKYLRVSGVVCCSECNDVYIYEEWLKEGKWHYCPNCGAKMDADARATKGG